MPSSLSSFFVVSLKETRAFRSMSFIAIVAVIAGPIERRRDETPAQAQEMKEGTLRVL
jgi:hypothetical protein